MTFTEARFRLSQDLRERAARTGKRYGWFSYVKLFLDPPALAVAIFRIQAWLYAKRFVRLAGFLRNFNIICFSIDIGSAAQIDTGLIIYHPNCVVICDQCIAGKNLHLVHHNTISISPRPGANPAVDRVVIEDDVILGCGSRLLGSLRIGANSFIGANAIVTEDVPPFSFFVEEAFTHTD